MRDLILMAVTTVLAVIAIGRPRFGILVFVAYGLAAPHSYTWGFARFFPHSMVISLCVLVGYLMTNEKGPVPRSREVFLLWALFVLFIFTSITAFHVEDAFVRLKAVGKMLLMVLVALSLMKGEGGLRSFLQAIAWPLGLYGLKGGVFVLATGGHYIVEGPEDSFLAANNSIGLALAMNLPLLFYLAKLQASVWQRWFLWAMFFLSYPAIACTFSRGAWIAAGIATGVLILRSQNKLFAWITAGMLVLVSPIILPRMVSQQLADRFDTFHNLKEDGSANSRRWNMSFCLQVGMTRPFTGAGFDFYSLEAYETFYPEFIAQFPGKVWSCHSMWLTVWAEHGVLGILLWVWLLVGVFRTLRRIRKLAKENEHLRWAGPYADMLQVALLSYSASGTFLDAAYFEVYYYLIGASLLLKETVLHSCQETQTTASSENEVETIRRPAFARLNHLSLW